MPASAPVFISYQRADAEYARLLGERLIEYGGDVWWDRAIRAGDDWREDIIAGLKRAEIVVLLHSTSAEKSEQVQKELAVASDRHKTLIAVRLENRHPEGRFLYEMAALNWVEAWRDPAAELDRLARQLAAMPPGSARAEVAERVGARPIGGSWWARIGHSWLALLAIWAGAMAIGLSGQASIGEGLGTTSPVIPTVVTFAFAPLLILRFIGSPPGSIGAGLMLGAALAMLACYALMARLTWRAAMRARAKRRAGPQGGAR